MQEGHAVDLEVGVEVLAVGVVHGEGGETGGHLLNGRIVVVVRDHPLLEVLLLGEVQLENEHFVADPVDVEQGGGVFQAGNHHTPHLTLLLGLPLPASRPGGYFEEGADYIIGVAEIVIILFAKEFLDVPAGLQHEIHLVVETQFMTTTVL